MRLTSRRFLIVGTIMVSLVTGTEQKAQALGQPQTSESTGPQDPRSTGSGGRSNEPLSEKLDRTDGVIRPSADIAPDMAVRPPVPDPGTTRVIPPPGASGGDQIIEPK